ncbi:MAG: zinc ribbon domain-containing protein [Proteobacteria bacterium]|nr:zinc ribbon domain-containing protein [Pseudomonadota bacterium]
MEYKEWGIPLQLSKHTPLISFETFNRVQDRLRLKAKAPVRKDIHLDFPLRGFVLCASCNKPLTACWSQGKYNKFPYYLCRSKGCPDCKKSVRKEVMEQHFEDILMELTPTLDLMMIIRETVKQIWKSKIVDYDQYIDGLRYELRETERKIEQFLDRIVSSDSETLIRAYETKITNLESQKTTIADKLRNLSRADVDFDTSFQTVFDFLGNPHKLWASGDINNQRLVLKLVFSEQLPYCRNSGFQTPEYSLPFKVSRGFIVGQSEMVVGRLIKTNQFIELIQAVNNLGKLLEAPPSLNAKTFEWSSLLKAA